MSIPPYGQFPTPDELNHIKAYFPNLKDKEWKKTGEKTGVTGPTAYNCYAWSLCRDDIGWIEQVIDALGNNNKILDVSDFDNFYHSRGYAVCGDCIDDCKPEKDMRKIALFYKNGIPAHASKEATDNNWWESKLGGNIRIMHRLDQLEGDEYGHVCRCYCIHEYGANPVVRGDIQIPPRSVE